MHVYSECYVKPILVEVILQMYTSTLRSCLVEEKNDTKRCRKEKEKDGRMR